MKDQINRFARGVFEYNSPVLEVLEKDINETVDKNREFNGAISFVEKEGGNLKGIIYSDNDRIVLKDNTFLNALSKASLQSLPSILITTSFKLLFFSIINLQRTLVYNKIIY